MTKNLFIHIGLSKTGSSAIQSWLSKNHESLKTHDFFYADLIPSAKEGAITAGNGVSLYRAANEKNNAEIRRLISDVYTSKEKNAIISSETLQNIPVDSIKEIKNACKELSIECTIIAYARSAYELLYSNYLQGVKRHGFVFKFGDGEPLDYKSQRDFLENYHSIFKEKLIVLNYDIFKGDITKSFSEILGIKYEFMTKLPYRKVNRSLTFVESEILRTMNIIHHGEFSSELSDFIISSNPELITQVKYDEVLLQKTKLNTFKDLDWINKNIKPLGGDIKYSLYGNKSINRIGFPENDVYENVLGLIIDWCFTYKPPKKKEHIFVNFLRDLALYLEDENLILSLKLMRLALKLRPNGPFIIKKVNDYEGRISKYPKSFYAMKDFVKENYTYKNDLLLDLAIFFKENDLELSRALLEKAFSYYPNSKVVSDLLLLDLIDKENVVNHLSKIPIDHENIFVFAFDLGHYSFILSYLIFIHRLYPVKKIKLILTSSNISSVSVREFKNKISADIVDNIEVEKMEGNEFNFIESLESMPCMAFFFKFIVSNDCVINKSFHKIVPCISIQGNSSLRVEPYYHHLFVQSEAVVDRFTNSSCIYPKVFDIPVDKEIMPDCWRFNDRAGLNIVSAARAGRIEFLLRNKPYVVDIIIETLLRFSSATWTLIGVNEQGDLIASIPKLKQLYDKGRLLVLPEINFLREYIRQCHIYCILPECGGGGMIAKMAVDSRLPCVGLNGIGDSLRSVTTKYISKSKKEYLDFLHELCTYSELREEVSEYQLNFQKEMGGEAEFDKFSSAIKNVYKRFYNGE